MFTVHNGLKQFLSSLAQDFIEELASLTVTAWRTHS